MPNPWVVYSAGTTTYDTFSNLRISESVASAITSGSYFSIWYNSEDPNEHDEIGNVCSLKECTEYCCVDYDPETGECIDWSPTDCCQTDCVSYDNGIVHYDTYSMEGTYFPFTFSDGYWTLNPNSTFMMQGQLPFEIELQA